MNRHGSLRWIATLLIGCSGITTQAAEDQSNWSTLGPLLRNHCVKCHGPAKQEGALDLSSAAGLVLGGENGAVVVPHDLEASLLWQRIRDGEMPPGKPLAMKHQAIVKGWILAGASGLPKSVGKATEHWAFRPLQVVQIPAIKDDAHIHNDLDRFVQATLEEQELTLGPKAERARLLRRMSLLLTGLPPSPTEIRDFLADQSSTAVDRAIDRLLASPQFGERWGKFWLDAAGYADSNGYFNADTDRPLAWRYRDYVVQSFNQGKSFDRFLLEQLAGDELADFTIGESATQETIELLTATHFLRNGQDGSGESDGNPDEVRGDRYAALESAMQNVTSSLLALTIQCAKCHDHKFEPITQRDFYSLQSFFAPAFNIENWVKPNDRFVYAARPGEVEEWEQTRKALDLQIAGTQAELKTWVEANRISGKVLFDDPFVENSLQKRWSATAPSDDTPGGTIPVRIDSDQAPAARVQQAQLQIIESGAAGNRWLSTKQAFDWTPNEVGASIQFTFDLVDHRLDPSATAAARIGFYIALHDYDDNSKTPGGNLLIDGNPGGATSVHLDYPGEDSTAAGSIGSTGYVPGRNYGVRVTNLGEGKYRLEQLVDWIPEEPALTLAATDLPDGGAGFEFCCGRSFIVDKVRIEAHPPVAAQNEPAQRFAEELKVRRKELARLIQQRDELPGEKPGKIAWVSDVSPLAPDVFLLERGNYAAPKDLVQPVPLSALFDPRTEFVVSPPAHGRTTGRRLALARWLIEAGSRQAGLVARVQVNRMWLHLFGTGLVATPENLGMSGSPPTHPELLDWLAEEFVRSGWNTRHVLRVILRSATFQQSSELNKHAFSVDPNDRLLWRYPPYRLDAESIRDSLLAVSGDLDRTTGGPYIPVERSSAGEVKMSEKTAGAHRRSLYLQQRRTQVLSMLAIFDAPSIVFNSLNRPRSTTPLQSLLQLNSEFSFARARSFANRLEADARDETARIHAGFVTALGRAPTAAEREATAAFLAEQAATYGDAPDAIQRAWIDFCQALLATNEFLYID